MAPPPNTESKTLRSHYQSCSWLDLCWSSLTLWRRRTSIDVVVDNALGFTLCGLPFLSPLLGRCRTCVDFMISLWTNHASSAFEKEAKQKVSDIFSKKEDEKMYKPVVNLSGFWTILSSILDIALPLRFHQFFTYGVLVLACGPFDDKRYPFILLLQAGHRDWLNFIWFEKWMWDGARRKDY